MYIYVTSVQNFVYRAHTVPQKSLYNFVTPLAIIADLITDRGDLVEGASSLVELVVVGHEVCDVAEDVDELAAHL